MPPVAEESPFTRLRRRFSDALGAWQPLTGRGLAKFADATTSRVLCFQGFFAVLAATAMAWSLWRMAFPPIQAGLSSLPEAQAGIQDRRLEWPGTDAVLLAQSPQFAVAVDPNASGALGLNGDIQLELGTTTLTLRGLLGQTAVDYPAGLELPLSRTAATAAWGAWRLPLLAIIGLTGFVGTLVSWWLLGFLYTLPVWLLCRLFGRAPSSFVSFELAEWAGYCGAGCGDFYGYRWASDTNFGAVLICESDRWGVGGRSFVFGGGCCCEKYRPGV